MAFWSTLHDPYLRPHFSNIKKGLRAPCAEVRIQKGEGTLVVCAASPFFSFIRLVRTGPLNRALYPYCPSAPHGLAASLTTF